MGFTIQNAIPLTNEQIARVDAAIAEVERSTSGEMVAVLARRSGVYLHAPYEAGLWGAGIAILVATIVSLIGWGWPLWYVWTWVAITGGGFMAGFFLTRIDEVERFFADETIMKAECEERAARLFTEHAIFSTASRTGVLLYVSLFEHMVIVLGDAAISEKLGPVEYQAVVATVIARIKDGKLEEGIVDGIRMLGSSLAEHSPPSPQDLNELPDRLYVIA